jgi:transcriptional regulator with XRE-family HTH domain
MGKPYFAHTNLGIAMVRKGWSVSDLSFETRINPRYIGYYLKGEKQMPPDHLRKIAQILRVDPRDIFQTTTEMSTLTPHQDHLRAQREKIKLRDYA